MLVDDFPHDPNRPPTSSHSIVGRHRYVSGILQQACEEHVHHSWSHDNRHGNNRAQSERPPTI